MQANSLPVHRNSPPGWGSWTLEVLRSVDGLGQLSAGVGELDAGSAELATGLSDGAAQVPQFSDDERATTANLLSSPWLPSTRGTTIPQPVSDREPSLP